jgi:LSD1 subclass zinc finger protein
MATLIRCPACRRSLRLPAGLREQSVKCPGCNSTFSAETASLVAGPGEDQPTCRWEHLRRGEALELTPHRLDRICPGCGKAVETVATHCPACGEDLEDEETGAWEEPSRGLRRDCEPHRGFWVSLLGNGSTVLGALAIPLCGVPGLVGLPLGIAAWVMGNADLVKMQAGLMDPAGRSRTRSGRDCGIVGLTLSGLCIVGYALLFLLIRLS